MNNFQQLQQIREAEFTARPSDPIRNRLESSLNVLRFMGHVADMYLPRVVDVIVAASDGQPNPIANYTPPTPPRRDPASGSDINPGTAPGPGPI